MRVLNKKMLSSAAAVAMIVAMPSAAFAFDAVDWTWKNKVTGGTDIDIKVKKALVPTGLTQVEKIQVQIGDVNAKSVVSGIDNNQPTGGTEAGTVLVDIGPKVFSAGGSYTDGNGPFDEDANNPVDDVLFGPEDGNAGGIVVEYVASDSDNVDEFNQAFNFDLQVSGQVEVDVPATMGTSIDARTELPTVDSAATAVGNNQSINSDVATLLHDGQYLFDSNERDVNFDAIDAIGAGAAIALGGAFIDNSHTAFAVGATALAITGTIDKAQVNAISDVSDILNARVDSSATAVGNNLSVNVNADGTPNGDSVLIADMTQFAYADLSAVSKVSGVEVNNYTHLAKVGPLVGSTATAVGNNVAINVGNVVGDL